MIAPSPKPQTDSGLSDLCEELFQVGFSLTKLNRPDLPEDIRTELNDATSSIDEAIHFVRGYLSCLESGNMVARPPVSFGHKLRV
jgi:hypothetical protein